MYFVLAIIGAVIGGLINAGIYYLGFKQSPASPWLSAPADIKRKPIHYLPLIGWWLRRSEQAEIGQGFWIRPLAIEMTWLIGLPYFYYWIFADGLSGGVPAPANWQVVWFAGYTVLFALLFIATFIDFDQRIIPDWITTPGTLVALLIAAFFPGFRLPKVVSKLMGNGVESVHFADGADLPTWYVGGYGLLIAITIFMIWAIALMPKYPLDELSWRGLKRVFVSTTRLLWHNGLKARAKSVRMSRTFLLTGVAGAILITVAWSSLPALQWTSLFSAIVGLGIGGFSIWLVRIVASHALGQEAMGFGDVTLMAMIGTFLGWQAALMTFAISPFAALAIAIVSYLVTKDNKLAFGPYLCFGAMLSVFGWSTLWPQMLPQFFQYPLMLFAVLTFSLILMMIMLFGLRIIKGNRYADED